MGLAIDKKEFSREEFRAYHRRLHEQLASLRQLLARPGFGAGPGSLGAELELYLVDDAARPALLNRELLSVFPGPGLTLELNRYNLEYNSRPHPLGDGNAFSSLGAELRQTLAQLQQLAASRQGRVTAIGILPTLTSSDFGEQVMTDESRYHALTEGLMRLRHGQPFAIAIDGPEAVQLKTETVTYEGANTSFQFHYRVAPERFAALYNAVQLVTPVALALGANSPLFLGHRLWHETRVALFKQSIDCRDPAKAHWHLPSRVSYGHGWLRQGAYQLFAEAVRLYPPLLPITREEEADDAVPQLYELRLHESTVWYWNRPVYDPGGDGHLRIEIRSLPAGPTVTDMLANAAFIIGVAEYLAEEVDEYLCGLPFRLARQNFYTAAERGLEAALFWPELEQSSPQPRPVLEIAQRLLLPAAQGLARIGVDSAEAEQLLGVIEQRIARRRSGASWQLDCLAHYDRRLSRQAALEQMMARYLERQAEGRPVAEWSVPQ